MAMLVIRTLRAAPVEQFTRNIGREKFARFVVFELMEAALAAAVAQSFPLCLIELMKRQCFPELFGHFTHLPISAAITSAVPSCEMSAIGLLSGSIK
jgi:hypothetical protein